MLDAKSLPHFQVMQREGKLVRRLMTPRDLCKGVYKKSVAVGSYSWAAFGVPDQAGERLKKHQNFLEENEEAAEVSTVEVLGKISD